MHLFPEQRLRRASDFSRVRLNGVYHDCGIFILQVNIASGPNSARARLGLVVSKRVGNAVTRNRVKRLFRELFRKNQDMLAANAELVLIARSGIVGLSLADLEARFKNSLLQIERRLEKKKQSEK